MDRERESEALAVFGASCQVFDMRRMKRATTQEEALFFFSRKKKSKKSKPSSLTHVEPPNPSLY